jgi:hypothetical protein
VRRTVEIAAKIGGIVARIDGIAARTGGSAGMNDVTVDRITVTGATMRETGTGIRRVTTGGTIAVTPLGAWAETTVSIVVGTIATTAGATTGPPV